MKVSVNWIRQFTEITASIDDLVQKIGAQLGAVEEVIDLGARYKGIVVAKVVSCSDHPDADRLHVCLIDDGGVVAGVERGKDGYVQVVCGATNVREGLLVAWLPPGVVVPSSFDSDPFILESRKLRGVMSHGMLASTKELSIGEDHTGILEIDVTAAPGTPFAEIYDLNDYIIDIENKMFTHRPDCFGILGVAREIAGIYGRPFVSPGWYLRNSTEIQSEKPALPLKVINEAATLVPRFMAIALADVTVRPSSIMIQSFLSRVGIRPINNIVDITNYIMALTGQPMHAYDYDKVAQFSGEATTLSARLASSGGERVALLNGKSPVFESPVVLIATDKQAIGVGGVMGGASTEVDNQTKNIILECANFDMYSIRKTSMKYGLFTDAVTRFNKGQSIEQGTHIIGEAVAMLTQHAGARVASEVYDLGKDRHAAQELEISTKFINERLGVSLSATMITELLRNVEFTVSEADDRIIVIPPYWRTDISIAEDIVEEVGRLYGFDNLPLELPRRLIRPVPKSIQFDRKKQIRSVLSQAGANEVLTYSFVHEKLLNIAMQNTADAYKISNAISPELQYLRLSLTPSLLEKVHQNIKAGYQEFVLFELNKSHDRRYLDAAEESLPVEQERVAVVYAAAKQPKVSAYYHAKLYLDYLAKQSGIEFDYKKTPYDENLGGPFEPSRTAAVYVTGSRECVGVIGEYKESIRKGLKLPKYSAGFEIDISIFDAGGIKSGSYAKLSRFPKVVQDITLEVTSEVEYQALQRALESNLNLVLPQNTAIGMELVDIFKKSDDHPRRITFRLTISSYDRTLGAAEVNGYLDTAASKLKTEVGAYRI